MNLRKGSHKLAAVFAAALLLAVTFSVPTMAADIFSGIEAAEDVVQSFILRLLTNVIAPLGASACGVAVVVLGIIIAVKHNKGDDPGRLVTGLIIAIIVGALLAVFSVWGPLMFNTTPSTGI